MEHNFKLFYYTASFNQSVGAQAGNHTLSYNWFNKNTTIDGIIYPDCVAFADKYPVEYLLGNILSLIL